MSLVSLNIGDFIKLTAPDKFDLQNTVDPLISVDPNPADPS